MMGNLQALHFLPDGASVCKITLYIIPAAPAFLIKLSSLFTNTDQPVFNQLGISQASAFFGEGKIDKTVIQKANH
jgi:hypothetical protein